MKIEMPQETPSKNNRLSDEVVAVIAICAIIVLAITAFKFITKPRTIPTANPCVNNLRMIQSGKEQAAMHHGWSMNMDCDQPENKTMVDSYIRGGAPSCSRGGTYRYNKLGEMATCSFVSPDGKAPHLIGVISRAGPAP